MVNFPCLHVWMVKFTWNLHVGCLLVGGFQSFFIFHNIWDNPSHSYFSDGYTTNQFRWLSSHWSARYRRQISTNPQKTLRPAPQTPRIASPREHLRFQHSHLLFFVSIYFYIWKGFYLFIFFFFVHIYIYVHFYMYISICYLLYIYNMYMYISDYVYVCMYIYTIM